jgi:hypothetical protein
MGNPFADVNNRSVPSRGIHRNSLSTKFRQGLPGTGIQVGGMSAESAPAIIIFTENWTCFFGAGPNGHAEIDHD